MLQTLTSFDIFHFHAPTLSQEKHKYKQTSKQTNKQNTPPWPAPNPLLSVNSNSPTDDSNQKESAIIPLLPLPPIGNQSVYPYNFIYNTPYLQYYSSSPSYQQLSPGRLPQLPKQFLTFFFTYIFFFLFNCDLWEGSFRGSGTKSRS